MSVKDLPWALSRGRWVCEGMSLSLHHCHTQNASEPRWVWGCGTLGKLKGKVEVVVVVQSFSRVRLLTSPWPAACQAPLSYTISLSLIKLMSVVLVMLSNHLTLCLPLLLLPSIFSSTRVFSNESAILIRWPKNCSFSITASSVYSEYSVFISPRIGCVVLLTVWGILKGHLSSTTIQ